VRPAKREEVQKKAVSSEEKCSTREKTGQERYREQKEGEMPDDNQDKAAREVEANDRRKKIEIGGRGQEKKQRDK
jgi:hypothetical protein